MPTGVAIRDVREQLFDAAERVLLRAGARALTSRAVTAEAGCAKGVLHRHFADFDDFLAELIFDRIRRIERQSVALRESAGTGTVTGHLTDVLNDLFSSVALQIIGLITFRDDLRARLRQAGASRVPVAVEATAMIASYLRAERDLGRVAEDADIDTLVLSLVGAAHLTYSGREGVPPPEEDVLKLVTSVIGGVLREPPASG